MSISDSIHHQNCEHLSNVNKNTALVNETCSQMGQKITNWEEAAKSVSPEIPALCTGYNILREKSLTEKFALGSDH